VGNPVIRPTLLFLGPVQPGSPLDAVVFRSRFFARLRQWVRLSQTWIFLSGGDTLATCSLVTPKSFFLLTPPHPNLPPTFAPHKYSFTLSVNVFSLMAPFPPFRDVFLQKSLTAGPQFDPRFLFVFFALELFKHHGRGFRTGPPSP